MDPETELQSPEPDVEAAAGDGSDPPHTYPPSPGWSPLAKLFVATGLVLAAAVLILMIPMLILFMFLQRYIISGLTSGSVKG